jgi:hypothetical protein
MKKVFVQQFQNSDIKKISWWPAGSHFVMQIFASLPNILPAPPDAPLAVSSVSELCLETCVNVFGQEVLIAEELNDDCLVVLLPSNENS